MFGPHNNNQSARHGKNRNPTLQKRENKTKNKTAGMFRDSRAKSIVLNTYHIIHTPFTSSGQ
jgi:hypothetical protein